MRIEIKPEKAEGEAIKAAAKEAGESTQVYILQAVRNRMEAEKAGATVCKIRNDAVGPAAGGCGAKYQRVCNAGDTRAHGARAVKK